MICVVCGRKLDPTKDEFLYLRVGARGLEEHVGLCRKKKCRREYQGGPDEPEAA